MRYSLLACCLLLVACGDDDPAARVQLQVYSRNLYIGAELTALASAPDADSLVTAARDLLQQAAATNFPERATAMAQELAAVQPELVGLQEVASLSLDGEYGPPPFRDYLADLLGALEEEGLSYRVAAVVDNTEIEVPLDLDGDLAPELLKVLDRDVILARSDITTTVARLECAHPSADGCNYSAHLPVDLPEPLPDTTVERGVVAVDTEIGGETIRFADTHLEIRGPVAGIDISAVQSAQAIELITILDLSTPRSRPIVLAGDFNSTPRSGLPSPYALLARAAYRDLWLAADDSPGEGFTCCQAPDLANVESQLDERIDILFVRNNQGWKASSRVGTVTVELLGDEPLTTVQPRWSSDHAGPAAFLQGLPIFR